VWRRLFWWTTERPTVLPWAIFFSLLLLILGDGFRRQLSELTVDYIYAPFYDMKYRIAASARVFDENRELRRQIAELSLENQRMRESTIENLQLRSLLGLARPWRGQVTSAEVVAPISPASGVMWIEVAAGRYVQSGWPVVTEHGLVGKVVEVRGNLARVRTLWDRLSRVAAYDQRSRVTGIISWESGPDLSLTYIQHQADIQAGDTVISSGWGEVFPKGLRVGTVDSVAVRPGEPFLHVSIAAVVEPGLLEHVFVIEPLATIEQDSLPGGLLQ